MNELKYVKNSIDTMNFVFLGEKISDGKVMKVPAFGDLNIDGFEFGYLVLTEGSLIKEHTHTNDVERYKLLYGRLSVSESACDMNICTLNNRHNIDKVEDVTIVQFCKINRQFFQNLESISPSVFDEVEEICLKNCQGKSDSLSPKK